MRIKLTVSYDGTDFRGWARQRDVRTVQGTLEEAIRTATAHDIEVVGASRTDSGAHAETAACHFDCDLPIPVDNWPGILNRLLKPDLIVLHADQVGQDFHARFCAEARHYRYRIRTANWDPFKSRYYFECKHELDVSQMNLAAQSLLGTHDFRAFTEELEPSIENTRRTILEIGVARDGEDEVHVHVIGTAFLRGMMRRISGGLVEVGRGQRSLESFAALLSDSRDQEQWPVVLPAKGLCLMRVRYGDPPRDCRRNAQSGEE